MSQNKQPLFEIQSLTSTQATPTHTRVALIISIVLLLVCALAYPYTMSSGLVSPAFSVIFTILSIFTALMTAYLLYGQFLSTRILSLAVLASTYLYASLINIPYLLTLPRIFALHGLFDAGDAAPAWLWIFWQIGYPFGILLYVLIDKRYRTIPLSLRLTRRVLLSLLVIIPLLVALLAFIAVDPYHLLPTIQEGSTYAPQIIIFNLLTRQIIFGLNALMCISALLLLHNRGGLHILFKGSVLHLWLRVSTLASLINVALSVIHPGGRYSVGWYIARVNELLAAIFVLCALLYEVNQLYIRLAQQNKELAQQNRFQSDFLAVVGHEFRTALTSILGFSEMICENDLNEQDAQEYIDDTREYANDIRSDATRLTRLIGDLLDLERMKSGRMEMNWNEVEINTLIWDAIRHTCPASRLKQLQIKLDPHIPPLRADRDKLIQVFTNLLSNAFKYSPEGGLILIESTCKGETVRLSIQDEGIGISQENLEQIFEPYARVESSATRYISGTGLGLPIVRRIISMHHGEVWVESTLGKGSTFHIKLPIMNNAETAENALQKTIEQE